MLSRLGAQTCDWFPIRPVSALHASCPQAIAHRLDTDAEPAGPIALRPPGACQRALGLPNRLPPARPSVRDLSQHGSAPEPVDKSQIAHARIAMTPWRRRSVGQSYRASRSTTLDWHAQMQLEFHFRVQWRSQARL